MYLIRLSVPIICMGFDIMQFWVCVCVCVCACVCVCVGNNL